MFVGIRDIAALRGLFAANTAMILFGAGPWRSYPTGERGYLTLPLRDQQTRRRTLTVCTRLRRVTAPLDISHRNTIWLFPAGRAGRVHWQGSGGWDTAAALAAALAGLPGPAKAPARAAGTAAGQFEMAFGPRFRLCLAALGTTTHRGVCLLPREPVSGIDPFGMIHRPGLTLTVAEPHRFAATVHDYYGPARLRDGDTVPA